MNLVDFIKSQKYDVEEIPGPGSYAPPYQTPPNTPLGLPVAFGSATRFKRPLSGTGPAESHLGDEVQRGGSAPDKLLPLGLPGKVPTADGAANGLERFGSTLCGAREETGSVLVRVSK